MTKRTHPGLGELLRYVGELVDHGAEAHYAHMNLNYRARYTPVLRAMQAGAATVTEITASTHLTQGAISQAVAQMEGDGLICRYRAEDGRKSRLHLTEAGKVLVERLEEHWRATFAAIETLEQEIGHPLRRALQDAASALQQHDFSRRLSDAKLRLPPGDSVNE